MLKPLSIKSLYDLALAEGEGLRIAYEYYAKRLRLSPWLRRIGRPDHILIAGLPEKHGAGLDFLQVAAEMGATVTVVDDRPIALAHFQDAFATARRRGRLMAVAPFLIQVDSLVEMAPLAPYFDLCLSSEVLQRLETVARGLYTTRLRQLAPAVALFAPNADNQVHAATNGLAGVTRLQMNRLVQDAVPVNGRPLPATGYLDIPPFPLNGERKVATPTETDLNFFMGTAIQGLALFAHVERLLPIEWRRQQSHLVYAFMADKVR